jgi:hypothetical protein
MKAYLGDGVYADLNTGGQLVLTTEDGTRVTNRIYLEPEVWTALAVFVQTAIEDRLNVAKGPTS